MPEQEDLTVVIQALRGAAGIPALSMYKDRCLRRRLAVRMRACGVETMADYAGILRGTPEEVERLLQTLTINVTQFFRNPEAWDSLEATLRARVTGPPLRCWSAGCATGEEAWTIVMMLADLGEGGRDPAWSAESRVDATDVDPAVLDRARAAVYPERNFGVPVPDRARRHLASAGPEQVAIRPGLRNRARFLRHDLGVDPPPDPPYDLIVCRNVVIYFGRDVQESLYQKFVDALAPGGVLLLGKVEGLTGPASRRMVAVDPRSRLYRRIA